MKKRLRIHRAVATSALAAASGLLASADSASAQGVVAYYDFNNSSNPAVVPDNSGNGHTGTPVGNAAYSAGGAPINGGGGTAFAFDGNGDSVTLDIAGTAVPFSTVTANNAGTVGFWTLTGQANQTHFGLYDGATRQFQAHVPWSDGNVYFDTGGCCDNGVHRVSAGITSTGAYDFNQWHHWAFVKDGDTNTIYRDGQLFVSGAATADIGAITAAFIGSRDTAAESVTGQIDDFIVFNRALTAGEVEILRTQGGDTFIPEPGTLGLLGLAGLGVLARRRRQM
jgi:hypothetical protein